MDKLLPISSGTVWADRIVISVATVHNIVVFVYILRYNLAKKEIESTHPSLYRSLFYVTTLCMLLMVLQDIGVLFVSTPMLLPPISCKLLSSASIILFFLGKCSVWYFNLIRLKVVFYGTHCAYSKWLLLFIQLIMTVAVLFCILYICIHQMYFENGYHIYQSQFQSCVTISAHTSALVWLVFESAINFVCFWLFWRKIKIMRSDLSNDTDQLLMYMVRKHAILIAASILSNYVLIILTFITDLGYAFSTFDTMVNIWCLLLFDKRFDSIYLKVFGCIARAPAAHRQRKAHASNSTESGKTVTIQYPMYSFETIPTNGTTDATLSIGYKCESTYSVPK